MRTAGQTHEGLGPGTNARERYDNHFDSSEIHPDGSVLGCSGEALRRTPVSDGRGNTIHVTSDAMGNRIKEEVKDSAGTLVTTQRNVCDALNRVKNLLTPVP